MSFVFTNPGHHVAMMAPVVRELGRRGVAGQLVSLAELRGLRTPAELDVPVRRVLPIEVRRRPEAGAGLAKAGGRGAMLRTFARRAAAAVLVPMTRRLVAGSHVVVVPNDAAFPYDRLIAGLDRPVVLMQEGIRFAMPNGDGYGNGGARRICAWGEGSRELFVGRGVSAEAVAVTGSPRHDGLDPARWRPEGDALLARLGLRARPLAILTNPIEHQGYGTARDRLALFEAFLREAEPALRARKVAIVVKNHAFEEPDAYRRAAAATPAADLVHVDPAAPLYAALAAAAGAVVMTSTAGIEALLFGVPIGALELPGGGFGFEYVERGAAVGLRRGAFAAGVGELLDGGDRRRAAGDALVTRHLHDRGRATTNVADVIAALVERRAPRRARRAT